MYQNNRQRGYSARKNNNRKSYKPYGRNRYNKNKKRRNPDIYVSQAQASTESETTYVEAEKFSNFPLNDKIQTNLAKLSYINPTPIQSQAIPYILDGKDVLGLASTGTGKTAAFLLPMVDKIMHDQTQQCLVICPTRELAEQTQAELHKFARNTNIYSALVIGGTSMQKQIKLLSKNPQFVIATPGRLKDLFLQGKIKLHKFNNIVLDEVDRMLDMGFIEDIKFLISELREQRQTMFFSATMTKEAETIANALMQSPVKVQVEKQAAHKNVEQSVVNVKGQDKVDLLQELLTKEELRKALIFSRTKRGADKLSKALYNKGFRADSIHGDKSQAKRSKVIDKFKNNRINILIATDVVARGLDVPDISHVINYDEPENYDDYIHRIGRTGRIGNKGYALTFVE